MYYFATLIIQFSVTSSKDSSGNRKSDTYVQVLKNPLELKLLTKPTNSVIKVIKNFGVIVLPVVQHNILQVQNKCGLYLVVACGEAAHSLFFWVLSVLT